VQLQRKENTGEQLFDNGLALPPFRLSLAVTDICLQLSTVIFKNYPKQLIIPLTQQYNYFQLSFNIILYLDIFPLRWQEKYFLFARSAP